MAAQQPQPGGHHHPTPPPGYHPHQHAQIGPFNPNKSHEDIERWVCIYPAYINSKKTLSEGRIIAKVRFLEMLL